MRIILRLISVDLFGFHQEEVLFEPETEGNFSKRRGGSCGGRDRGRGLLLGSRRRGRRGGSSDPLLASAVFFLK